LRPSFWSGYGLGARLGTAR